MFESYQQQHRFRDGRNYQTEGASARLYILQMVLFIAGGLWLSGFASMVSYTWEPGWILILGCFVVAMIGLFITFVESTFIAAIGYTILTMAFGAMIGPVLAMYELQSVATIFFATIVITGVIGIAGMIYPKSVAHWGGFLFTGLTALIVCQFGSIILTMFGYSMQTAFTALDWVGIFLFSLYIFYDMNQAMRAEYTTYNALRFAVGMYLNILNLFLRLLSIFGTKNDD